MEELKIGLLIPRSVQYAELSFHFADSFRYQFSLASGQACSFFIEDVGLGATQGVVMDKCQKLLLQHQVDLVVAFVGNRVAVELAHLFNTLKKILIITNWGENCMLHPFSPYVFYHSLGLWKNCWEMGFCMAQNIGRNVLAATSFYDSGYGLLNAVVKGIGAGMGNILQIEIIPEIHGKPFIEKLAQTARETKPDVICGIFSGNFAASFLSQYAQHEQLNSIPLMGTANIMDKIISENINVHIYVTSSFRHPINNIRKTNDSPFYILGSEIAMILQYALDGKKLSDVDAVIDRLENCTIESPRGRIEMIPKLHITAAPSYLAYYNKQEMKIISKLDNFPSAELLVGDADQFSGFFNPYLCV